MSIYSNDNISKIAKLTPRELLHLAKTAKITVRENNGVYSKWYEISYFSKGWPLNFGYPVLRNTLYYMA